MLVCFFFLMIRRPPRSTQGRSSAASDVYKRQRRGGRRGRPRPRTADPVAGGLDHVVSPALEEEVPVSYTHLRAHETVLDLVCRLLLEKKK